jgi:hypothetical protein
LLAREAASVALIGCTTGTPLDGRVAALPSSHRRRWLRRCRVREAEVKTDKVDARILAQLLAADFLPAVWLPDERTRVLRRLATRRAHLLRQRVRLRNQVQAILFRNMLDRPPVADLFGKRGRFWLQAQPLPADERQTVTALLRQLDFHGEELGLVDREFAGHALTDANARRLMTVPGIDVTIAMSIVAAVGDFHRFAGPEKLVDIEFLVEPGSDAARQIEEWRAWGIPFTDVPAITRHRGGPLGDTSYHHGWVTFMLAADQHHHQDLRVTVTTVDGDVVSELRCPIQDATAGIEGGGVRLCAVSSGGAVEFDLRIGSALLPDHCGISLRPSRGLQPAATRPCGGDSPTGRRCARAASASQPGYVHHASRRGRHRPAI